MTDYIKREDALDIIADNNVTGEITLNRYDKIIDGIYDIPSADVVPIVRCKECIYDQDNNGGYPHDGCRWRSDETPDADDFCSFAERKDDETI